MQGFQLAEEFTGGKRIEGCAGQSLAQRLEQAWHTLQQLLAGQRIIMRADAPDQLVHGIQGLPPLGRSLAMLEADQQHHLAPGIPQQAHHHLRQDLAEQSLVQHLLHVLPSQFGLGAAFLGVAGALLEELAAAALVAGEGNEVLQQLGEDRRVVDEVVQQPHHDLFDLLVQAVAPGIIVFGPAQRRGCDLVEQATRRMATAAEEGLVEQGHLEHRDLHPTDHGLQRIRQGAVIENEFEQHRHQVDDVIVHLADHPRTAALVADPLEQLVDPVADVELRGARARQVLLQVGKQAHQVVAGNRRGILRRFATVEGRIVADLRQQFLQRAEDFLLTAVEQRSLCLQGPGIAYRFGTDSGLTPRQRGFEFRQHARSD